MHYYKFNIGDYSSATQHLEPMEDLAYRRMLDLYYQKESPLPLEVQKIARLIRMRSHTECIESVLHEFFTKKKDGWHNSGADKALEKVYKKSEVARRSALARWSKNNNLDECERNANASKSQCETDADGMLPITHYPLPITQDNKDDGTTPCKQVVQHQQVLDTYHEVLPMLPKVQVYSEKRKTAVRNFFKKRTKEKGSEFTIENLKNYLEYILNNCHWMLENRQRPDGTFWKVKDFDYIMSDRCYIAVKEQRHDDLGVRR